MKNILSIVAISVGTFYTAFAQHIQFPESFKYDAKIIKEMKLAEITDEVREVGIHKNPAVFTSKDEMRAIINDYEVENVDRIYIEFYEEVSNDEGRRDAGIVVSEFHSKKHLQEILPMLYPQSNYVFLTVDKYLILVWNDGRASDEKLRASVAYYEKKIGAKEFIAENKHPYSEETFVEDETTNVEIFEAAPEGMFTNLGFGSVLTEIFMPNELQNLQSYIVKFQENYNTEVGIVNVGRQDLTEDMMQGYASHLVFNFEERIKNNIVILFDEVENRSWVYFGTENGKTLNKLPLEKLKQAFNKKIATHEVYKGLNKLLMELEVALINSSGSEAKIPSSFYE